MMKTNPFEDRLNALATKMEVQAFVRVHSGLCEHLRITSVARGDESGGELSRRARVQWFHETKQINDWESEFQSTEIPIPDHAPLDAESKISWVVCCAKCSDRRTRTTRYIGQHSAWFNAEGTEAVGIRHSRFSRQPWVTSDWPVWTDC